MFLYTVLQSHCCMCTVLERWLVPSGMEQTDIVPAPGPDYGLVPGALGNAPCLEGPAPAPAEPGPHGLHDQAKIVGGHLLIQEVQKSAER